MLQLEKKPHTQQGRPRAAKKKKKKKKEIMSDVSDKGHAFLKVLKLHNITQGEHFMTKYMNYIQCTLIGKHL